ncbi:hypothetical protein BB561_006094 [Smittium simulii]|uniref:Endonuclease/exonuclease/phosphatase domain-containing protein n=1 Tax=Smittium simulii TaxID=133385 RepID=A0A2T9Y6K8_9FUNG|nr:hypothetical protein BB561_006094 [Smittium simulii]
MKPTLTIATITAFILSLSVIKGQALLSGRSKQRPELEAALRKAGGSGVRCKAGYLGLDCEFMNNDLLSKLSCDLKVHIRQKNGNFRHEIHYDTELEITLSEAFKMLEKKYGAYIREDSNKKNRKNTTKIAQPKKIAFKNNTKLKLITYNIQSIYNKVEELELILSKSASTVLCLQETHLSEKSYFFKA